MRYRKFVATFLIPVVFVHCSEASLLTSARGEKRNRDGGEETELGRVRALGLEHLTLRPQDLSQEEAKELGKRVIQEVGYDNLIQLALQTGLIQTRDGGESSSEPENGIQPISWGYITRAGYVFTEWAISAGVTSQLDSPVPGPGDVVAAAMLFVGVVDALVLGGILIEKANESQDLVGIPVDYHWKAQNKLSDEQARKLVENVRDLINSWMAKGGHQNVKDSGIEAELQAAFDRTHRAIGLEVTKQAICELLKQLQNEAEAIDDKKRIARIRQTQKGYDCRNQQKRK